LDGGKIWNWFVKRERDKYTSMLGGHEDSSETASSHGVDASHSVHICQLSANRVEVMGSNTYQIKDFLRVKLKMTFDSKTKSWWKLIKSPDETFSMLSHSISEELKLVGVETIITSGEHPLESKSAKGTKVDHRKHPKTEDASIPAPSVPAPSVPALNLSAAGTSRLKGDISPLIHTTHAKSSKPKAYESDKIIPGLPMPVDITIVKKEVLYINIYIYA
jgi:hypothetical protein